MTIESWLSAVAGIADRQVAVRLRVPQGGIIDPRKNHIQFHGDVRFTRE